MGKWLILPSACATSARAPGTNSNTQKTTAPPRHPGKMPKKSIAFKWGFEPVPVRQQRHAFSLAPLVTACRPYLRDEDRSAAQAKRETLRDALWRLAPARNNKTTGPSQPRGAPKGKRPRQNAKKKADRVSVLNGGSNPCLFRSGSSAFSLCATGFRKATRRAKFCAFDCGSRREPAGKHPHIFSGRGLAKPSWPANGFGAEVARNAQKRTTAPLLMP